MVGILRQVQTKISNVLEGIEAFDWVILSSGLDYDSVVDCIDLVEDIKCFIV